MFAMLGVSAGGLFLKRALEKLHVQVQTLQYKEYKGAAEMFSRDTMSAPLRESLQAIIGDWRQVLTDRIARARKLPPEKAAELIGRGFMSARMTRKTAGLIDREGYGEDIRAEFDPEGKRKKFIGLARYLRHAMHMGERGDRHRIAFVCGVGPVIAGDPSMSGDFISARNDRRANRARLARRKRRGDRLQSQLARRLRGRLRPGLARGPRRAEPGANRWWYRWAMWPVPAATTSRWVQTRSSRKPRPSPDPSAWCMRSSTFRR